MSSPDAAANSTGTTFHPAVTAVFPPATSSAVVASNGGDAMGAFRPRRLSDMVGQAGAVEKIGLWVSAYRSGIRLPHCVFTGPAGTGKTTLASVMASEACLPFIYRMATNIKSRADLVSLFQELPRGGSILLLDETHALSSALQECLYDVLEEGTMEVKERGKNGAAGKVTRIQVPAFTFVGATTHKGKLNAALCRRLNEVALAPYCVKQLTAMAETAAVRKYGLELMPDVAANIARIARGSAARVYMVVDDLVRTVQGALGTGRRIASGDLTRTSLFHTLRLSDLDPQCGLDPGHRAYLIALARQGGGPCGEAALATLIGQEAANVAALERLLMQPTEFTFHDAVRDENRVATGPLVIRTSEGRILTEAGYLYLGYCRDSLQTRGWFPTEDLSAESGQVTIS